MQDLDALDRGVIEAGTLAARALEKAEKAEKHAEALVTALYIMGSATADRALVTAMAEALAPEKLIEIRGRARELEVAFTTGSRPRRLHLVEDR